MVKAILFDWHGVLDDTKLEDLFKKTAQASSIPLKTVKSHLSDVARQYALGFMDADQFWLQLRTVANLSGKQTNFLRRYINSIEKNELLWKFLPEINKKYTLAILSDCPLEKSETIRKKIPLTVFALTLFSAEVHKDKKMKEFFFLASDALGLKPHECLFVDDSSKNTFFAKEIGFLTHQFRTTEEFIKYMA